MRPLWYHRIMSEANPPLGQTTSDMILSLAASGMEPDQIIRLYADLDPEQIRRTLRRALRKAPMFLDP